MYGRYSKGSAEHFEKSLHADLELFGVGRGVVGDYLQEGEVQRYPDGRFGSVVRPLV